VIQYCDDTWIEIVEIYHSVKIYHFYFLIVFIIIKATTIWVRTTIFLPSNA